MPQIIRITSEALQATIRRLLPSQQGFGEDLQATNVITPIIDLTPTAEGSNLPYDLQTANNFGGATAFNVSNASTDVITTSGFYRVQGAWNIAGNTASVVSAAFNLNDGSSSKKIYEWRKGTGTSLSEFLCNTFDFTIFLRSGDKLNATCTSSADLIGSYRQIADLNGNLVDPSGFTPQ